MKHMIETMKLEKGKVTMCDMPFIFTFTKSIYYIQKELEKVLGEKWKKIAYECGKLDGIVCNSNYLALFQDDPKIKKLYSNKFEAFKFCVAEFNKMGKGKLEIIEADTVKIRFLLRFHFNGIALAYLEHEKTTEPICCHFAGVFAGATDIIYPGAEAVETKCMAKGDPYCEFVIEIAKKK
jgi:predicted hydrocarbon binding protein